MATSRADTEIDESAPPPPGMRYEHGKVVPHLTVAERVARGKAARREVPARATPGSSRAGRRPDPVALLESQAASRVPELVPIRYGRMLVSPFTFYRGAALIMANDLAATPRSGMTAQLCGDAHLMNFGAFAFPGASPGVRSQRLRRDVPRPVGVGRQAARGQLRDRRSGQRLLDARTARRCCCSVVGGYRAAMREYAGMTNLDVWYAHIDVDDVIKEMKSVADSAARKRAQANVAKARTRDSMSALNKLSHVVDGERRIISDPPLIQPIEELLDGMELDERWRG